MLPPRLLSNYHSAWMEATELLPTGKLYREWTGLFAISGCLTRRVWLQTNPAMPNLYPNLYAMLVGRPATGKDVCMTPLRRLYVAANAIAKGNGINEGYWINLGDKSLSAKGLVDALAHEDAKLILEQPSPKGPVREFFHSIILITPELGVLLPEYNPALVSTLCDLYNCDDLFSDRIRNGRGEATVVENPHCAILLGTQPQFLGTTFPEEAYGMGFFSRVVMVYEPEPTRRPMYDELSKEDIEKLQRLWKQLASDTHRLTRLVGKFTIPSIVQQRINAFHERDCDSTALPHSRFEDYNSRRSLHLQKMAMCFSVARSDDLVMEPEDWERAIDLLFRTERRMLDIFSNMSSSKGFHNTVEEVVLSARQGQTYLTEQEIVRQLRRRHKPHEVMPIINNMISAGDLKVIGQVDGFRTFQIIKEGPQLKLVRNR